MKSFQNKLIAIENNNNNFTEETEFVSSNGKIIQAIVKLQTFENNNRILFSISDITKLKNAEKRIIESKQNYKLLFEKNPLALFEEDFSKTIKKLNNIRRNGITNIRDYLNKNPYFITECLLSLKTIGINYAAFKLFECKSKLHFAKNIHTFFNVKSTITLINILVALYNEKKYFIEETEFVTANNKTLNTIIQIQKIGISNKVIVSITDITKQKQNDKELLIAKQEADKSNKLKSEFLANMSHEIRTPMNAVLGFSEILKSKIKDNPEKVSLINGIIKGGENLIELINDILDLSKIEAGQLNIVPQPVSLSNIIYDIKQFFLPKIKSKNLKFIVEIDKQLPKSILLDKLRIRQILFNLVGNAIKFTDIGSIKILVKIDNKFSSSMNIRICIKDTGIGIPKNQFNKIFEVFQQAKNQSEKYKGTGLGLPISKRLVEAMNGTLTIDSVEGKGSVFCISLKDVVISSINVPNEDNEITFSSIKNIRFKEAKILLVEDIESNRDIVKSHLEKYNCKVFEAINGQEAINFLKKNKVDLILMDIQMPVLNGYDATLQIRKCNLHNSAPIVALTALALKEQVNKYNGVFDGYLKKPISIDNIIKHIMTHLPYTKIKDKESIDEEIQNLKDSLKIYVNKNGKLPTKTISIYTDEILPLFNEVKDILDTNGCKNLALKIQDLGKKYNIQPIKKFGNKLLATASTYKINEMEKLLNEFIEIIMD